MNEDEVMRYPAVRDMTPEQFVEYRRAVEEAMDDFDAERLVFLLSRPPVDVGRLAKMVISKPPIVHIYLPKEGEE